MRKLIAAINMTLDGFCDHTAMVPAEGLHQHYNDLLRNSDILIYGRTTYQLMESFWPEIARNPNGDKVEEEFAGLIDNIQKIVFSRALKSVTWKNLILKKEIVKEEILELKRQPGKPIVAGSPSLIVALAQLGLVDEFQLGVGSIILGSGRVLFKNIKERIDLKLLRTESFGSGAVVLYYEPADKRGGA